MAHFGSMCFLISCAPAEVLPATYSLQEVGVAVIGQNQCLSQHAPDAALLNNTEIVDEMMCAKQNGRGLCLVSLKHISM